VTVTLDNDPRETEQIPRECTYPGFAAIMAERRKLTPERRKLIDSIGTMAEVRHESYLLGMRLLESGDEAQARHWLQLAADHEVFDEGLDAARIIEEHAKKYTGAASRTESEKNGLGRPEVLYVHKHRGLPEIIQKSHSGEFSADMGRMPHSASLNSYPSIILSTTRPTTSTVRQASRPAPVLELPEKPKAVVTARTPLQPDEQPLGRVSRLRNVLLSTVGYGSVVAVDSSETDYFAILMFLAKGSIINHGPERATISPGRIVVASPSEPLRTHLSRDARLAIVRTDRRTVESTLSALLGQSLRGTVKFNLEMRVDGKAHQQWNQSLIRFLGNIQNEQPTARVSFLPQFEESLIIGLLSAQPHNYSELLRRAAAPASVSTLRMAIDLMESHPEWAHTTMSLARGVGVNVRSLASAFRKNLGTSPTAYLRSVRIQRAYKELRCANPGETTASAVAERWGFSNMGRFSLIYHRTFGETPAQTLRR
jgi:AraC-like DNA-binding protein